MTIIEKMDTEGLAAIELRGLMTEALLKRRLAEALQDRSAKIGESDEVAEAYAAEAEAWNCFAVDCEMAIAQLERGLTNKKQAV